MAGAPGRRSVGIVAWMAALSAAGVAAGAVCAAAPAEAPPEPVRQYRLVERAVEADADPAASLDRDVIVSEWTGPDGTAVRVPAFWDGGRTWRVRFAPVRPGRWTYRVCRADGPQAAAAGGAGGGPGASPAAGETLASGTLDVQPADAADANPLHRHGPFLKVAPGGRHLAHTDGTPFFWLGDTWWFCPSDLVPIDASNRPGVASMYKALVDKRAAQRFTILHMAFLDGIQTPAGRAACTDVFGGTIHPAYWQQADRYLRYANEKGLVPVIGFGFHHMHDQSTVQQLERLWRYALARFGAMGVSFLICGEYNIKSGEGPLHERGYTPVDLHRIDVLLGTGRFIRDRDPYARAMTIHPWAMGLDGQQAWAEPWYDFVMLQGGHAPHGPSVAAYREACEARPVRPVLEGECTYEGIYGMTADVVRRNAYKAVQAGCFGYTYGAHGLWYPTQDETDRKFDEWGEPIPWWRALEAPGADHMTHLRAAYERVRWWKLVPIATQRLAWQPDRKPGRGVWVKAEGDDTLFVYYAACEKPSPAPFLQLEGEGGAYAVTVFDPRTGEATTPAGTVDAESGRLRLPAPPDERDGVVILERRPG